VSRSAFATIHLGALRHNLGRIRALAPDSRVMAVIKADGYGHGLERVARALSGADAFGVAAIADGQRLRAAGIAHRIVVLSGIDEAGDLLEVRRLDLDIVVHHDHQLALLRADRDPRPLRIWLKLDTGMHRLGFDPARTDALLAELRALGAAACGLTAELGDEAAVEALVPAAVEQLGRLDAVVNSASSFAPDDIASLGYAQLQQQLLANTGAPLVLAQALAEHVALRNAPGAVVNLLDQKLWNPNPDFLSYTLSKAALESATTLLALALAPNVRVVGVAPGLTLTSEWLQGEAFAQAHRLSPLGRSSTPEDVAATVAFALGNRSMTGTTLLVDGGQHLQRFERDFSMM